MPEASSRVNTAGEDVCSQCGGVGWIFLEKDGISGAERCSCAAQNRPRRIEDQAGIPPLYSSVELDSFRTSVFTPSDESSMKQVLLRLKSFVKTFPVDEPPGLLFIGGPGTGKTHLGVAVLRDLIRKGFEGLFFDYQTLLDRIRSGYDTQSGATDKEAYRSALEADVLLLDDLGAHRANEFTQDIVTGILTHRCNHRKPLIATTNLPVEQTLGKTDGAPYSANPANYQSKTLGEIIGWRAVSRLHEMCRIVRMPITADYRMRRR